MIKKTIIFSLPIFMLSMFLIAFYKETHLDCSDLNYMKPNLPERCLEK